MAGPRPADTPIETGPPASLAGAVLTVDLGALTANWRTLAGMARGAEAAAVVKADAYGLGLEPVGRALADVGCRTFFVAQPSEGMRLRAALPAAAIYILNGLPPGAGPAFLADRLRPVLGNLEELAEWRALPDPGPAALHVDTGMNRLGLRPEEAQALAEADLRRAGVALLMSHLVSAERPDDPANARQLAVFSALRARFAGIPASLANSSGVFLGAAAHFDLLRPGYALYGGNPTPGRPNPMRPVVGLRARVIQVRNVPAGETVGYNGQWTAPNPARIAVIGVGYADGYLRSGSASDAAPGSVALVAGRPCPFAGRVSMDLIAIDVSALPDGAVGRGDAVDLIGGPLDIDTVGRHLGTNGYEVLTSLGKRYRRRYLS